MVSTTIIFSRLIIVKPLVLLLFVSLFFYVMEIRSETDNGFDLSKSIVPISEILSGGPPRDGIPALTDPEFVAIDKAVWVEDDARILGVYINGIAKAYPLQIMNWHEIVNDTFGNKYVLVTYCPLCFSGIAFDPIIDGDRHLFGVSGLLYNSDVLLYDRKTSSLWSQIMSRAITGNYVNQKLKPISTENTTWRDWRSKHPNTLVLSRNTGSLRSYERDPYIDYRKSLETMFPVKFRAQGYHPKELVLGITINNISKAYPISELSRTSGFINDNIAGENIHIHFNKSEISGTILDSKCKTLPATTLFWFAWYTFHPDTEIFKASKTKQPSTHEHC
jgi:uncharacterized protein DUF3179